MSILELVEVEIAQNDSEQGVKALFELAKTKLSRESVYFLPEILDLCAENEETKLCISKKDDRKHDEKSTKILSLFVNNSFSSKKT